MSKNKKVNKNHTANENNSDKKKKVALIKTQQKEEAKTRRIINIFKKIEEILKKKWLIKSSTTILLVFIIFAIYWFGSKILEKVNIPDIDCTQEKRYTVSEESKNRIKDIDKDIKITLINFSANSTIKSFLDQYKATNKKISVDQIDNLEERIDIQQQYDIDSSDSIVIVESEGKEKVLTYNDLFQYDYSTGEQKDSIEEAITNAIVNITADYKPKIYFSDNHSIYSFDLYFAEEKQILEDDANEVKSVNLLAAGRVPEDCDTLVITTLKEDITEPERDYIIDYINNGGNLLVLCGANVLNANLQNFEEVLDIYGISMSEGLIIEGNQNNVLAGLSNKIIEDVLSSSITKNNSLNMKMYLPNSANIETEADQERIESLNVTYETLVKTTDQAFLRTDLSIVSANRTDKDSEEKECIIGVSATKKIDEEKESKLVIYGSELFPTIMTQNYYFKAGNNQDVLANSVAYLNQKENNITIRKNFDYVNVVLNEEQAKAVTALIFGLPIAIIIYGIFVTQIRKRK